MERFAANYLYLPDYGFLKQGVMEREGDTIRIYPLKEEIEAVVWVPGIICMLPAKDINAIRENDYLINKKISTDFPELILASNIMVIQLFPFDFTKMILMDNTEYTLL